MIEEIGVVVRIDSDTGPQHIWVETEIKTTCNSCQAQSNCGTSVVAKAFANKKQHLQLAYDLPIQLGQKVKIGIPEEKLLSASLLVYLLPILGLICGSVLASAMLPLLELNSELWIILTGLSMATAVMFWVKRYLNGVNQQQFCPQLLDVAKANPQAIVVKQL